MNQDGTKHILVVDDEEGIRLMLEKKLVRAGYKVSVVPSATHALKKISSQNFDLIISDLKMPRMSGAEFHQNLISQGHEIPFILLTGFPEDTESIASISGVSTVLLKPVRHNELIEQIRQLTEEEISQIAA